MKKLVLIMIITSIFLYIYHESQCNTESIQQSIQEDSIPTFEYIESNQQNLDDDLNKILTMEGIKNPYIIEHLFKDVYQPAMDLLATITKMYEKKLNITLQIDALIKYMKSSYIKFEFTKAQNLQKELDLMEEKYSKLTTSDTSEVTNPSMTNPYDRKNYIHLKHKINSINSHPNIINENKNVN